MVNSPETRVPVGTLCCFDMMVVSDSKDLCCSNTHRLYKAKLKSPQQQILRLKQKTHKKNQLCITCDFHVKLTFACLCLWLVDVVDLIAFPSCNVLLIVAVAATRSSSSRIVWSVAFRGVGFLATFLRVRDGRDIFFMNSYLLLEKHMMVAPSWFDYESTAPCEMASPKETQYLESWVANLVDRFVDATIEYRCLLECM